MTINDLTEDQLNERIKEIEFTLANSDRWSREFEISNDLVELRIEYNLLLEARNNLHR